MTRRYLKTGLDNDVHTRWRRLIARYRRAGETRRDKKLTTRRERRETRNHIKEQEQE